MSGLLSNFINRAFLPACAILLALALVQAGAVILISLEYNRLADELAAGFSPVIASATVKSQATCP